MKKSFRKSKVFIAALILMLSLTACGGDKKGSTENTNTAVESGKKEAKSGTLKPGDEVPDVFVDDKRPPWINISKVNIYNACI